MKLNTNISSKKLQHVDTAKYISVTFHRTLIHKIHITAKVKTKNGIHYKLIAYIGGVDVAALHITALYHIH